jgi:hypothetical protein
MTQFFDDIPYSMGRKVCMDLSLFMLVTLLRPISDLLTCDASSIVKYHPSFPHVLVTDENSVYGSIPVHIGNPIKTFFLISVIC